MTTMLRRDALKGLGAASLTACGVAENRSAMRTTSKRMPTAFVPHAGGPLGHVEMGGSPAEVESFVGYWRSLRNLPSSNPKAVLIVSAHWEAPVWTVMSSAAPPMLYDYSGFPQEAYQITWPAPGHPELAARIRAMLGSAGLSSAEDPTRGFDHGTFVPLKIAYPAHVPVIQLSLKAGLDAAEHLRLGRVLEPLRDDGVFIIGSGDSFHNMRGFSPEFRERSETFNAWLTEAVMAPASRRATSLTAWESAPFARQCHPREEHLIPLMVVAGAAGEDAGTATWSGSFFGPQQTGYHFG